MIHTVYWEGLFPAANPNAKPSPDNPRNLSWCAGWYKSDCASAAEAQRLHRIAFPDTRVVDVR